MTIRIRKLTEGYIVSDDTGWEVAAVTEAEAINRAEYRRDPSRLPSPPPAQPGQDHAQPVHPLAERQFGQATGETEPCVGSLCGSD
jgi:hypothetical protein